MLFDDAFFLQGAKSGGRNVAFDLFTINNQGFLLDIWFENLASLSLGERNVVPVHFTFTGDFTDCHYFFSFTVLTIASKAFGLFTARSASILRSMVMFLAFMPAMS